MKRVIGTSMFLLLDGTKKVPIYDVESKTIGEVELPVIFNFPIRKDLIRRAFLAEFTARLQPKGRDPLAGKRTSARSLGVGLGIARVPRIPGLGRAAFVNSAVGGHLAHPPRVEKKIHERINKKEKKLATISALSATSIVEIVRNRGHIFSIEQLPVIIDDSVEDKISKTKEAKTFLEKIGIWQDIIRAKERTRIRAGKGKRRGRRYIEPRSILFITNNYNSPLARSIRNLPGVDIIEPWLVSVLHLAPGGEPGRLTMISYSSLEELSKRFSMVPEVV